MLPELKKLMQLEEWHHPDVVDDEHRPRGSETFRQLAEVLVSGDARDYAPTCPSNTHWSNWPDGGTLWGAPLGDLSAAGLPSARWPDRSGVAAEARIRRGRGRALVEEESYQCEGVCDSDDSVVVDVSRSQGGGVG